MFGGHGKRTLSPSRGLTQPRGKGTAELKEEKPMKLLRTFARWGVFLAIMVGLGLEGSAACADPLYGITDLGTLSGQSSSVATSINNNGQVVGISYNSSDGNFSSDLTGPTDPPRFQQTGDGAQSFLYNNGQMSLISPVGGLATSINNLGQVVGGSNGSINDSGQYISGSGAGIDSGNFNMPSQLFSGGVATALPLSPSAINNNGEVAGAIAVGGTVHAATYQNGQLTDLYSKVGTYNNYSQAVAMNQNGDLLITLWTPSGGAESVLYHAGNGTATPITGLPGGSGTIAAGAE